MKIKKSIFMFSIIIVVASFFFLFHKQQPIYTIDGDTFVYTQNRPAPQFTMTPLEEKENWSFSKFHFASRPFLNTPQEIYGFLFIPKNTASKVPGIILIPGAGGTKEGEARLADILTKEGVAVFTIDQRGIGQTSGTVLPYEEDAQLFMQGKEPQQHLMVYDALVAFDILRNQPQIDPHRIIFIGESMGGRYAIIAAALEPRVKGVIAISSSGFHVQRDLSSPQQRYLVSIDPDHYLSKLSPRPFVMLHAQNDSVIPIASAQLTFQKASEPKRFLSISDPLCTHGYCDPEYENLKEALEFILDESH